MTSPNRAVRTSTCGEPVPDPVMVTILTVCGLRRGHRGDHRTTGTLDGWLYRWPAGGGPAVRWGRGD